MRSRYSAYAVGDIDYVWRTWHPRTRPEQVQPDPSITWTRLEILRRRRGHRRVPGAPHGGVLHETSRFERRAGRWFYVDGEIG